MFNEFLKNQSVVISLDVDPFLFDRLANVAEAGFTVVEVNTSDSSLLQKIISHFPSLHIGAGNIINLQQLDSCYQAGAHFISSPGFLPELVQTSAVYSINYLPGISSVSEGMQVLALGCQQARPYPANLPFCALLNKCLPMLRLYPAEIEWDGAEHYLTLPSVSGVGISNPEISHLKALSSTVFS